MTARRRRRLIVSGSIAAHAVVLAAFVISGMWKIERLDAAPTDTMNLALTTEPAMSGGSPHPKATPAFTPKPPRVRVDHSTQPVVNQPTDTTPSSTADSTDTGPDSDVVGPDIGGGGKCTKPPCGDDKKADPKPTIPEVVVPPPVKIIPPSEAVRTDGDTDIHPSETDKTTMLRDDHKHVMGIFKVCISATGSIDSVARLRSTKFNDYDNRIMSTMRSWRYRPYAVNGVPTPVCTSVTFSYTMK